MDGVVEVSLTNSHRPITPLMIDPKYLDYSTIQDFNPDIRMVDPATLWVDDKYQRNPTRRSIDLVKKIIKNWAWDKFKPPIVTEYEGKLFVIDGQHTSIAAVSHPGVNKIPIFVVSINTVSEAASAFLAHNTDRTMVTPIQLFKARIEAGDEDAISINMALNRAKVKLSAIANQEQREGTLSCISTLEKVFSRYGMMALRITLDICVAGKLAPIQAHYVNAISDLMFKKEYKGKFDAQALALTIRDYPYVELVSDVEVMSRREKKKRNEVCLQLVKRKYESMFGDIVGK